MNPNFPDGLSRSQNKMRIVVVALPGGTQHAEGKCPPHAWSGRRSEIDRVVKFFADRNLRQIILHFLDTGRKIGNVKLLNR